MLGQGRWTLGRGGSTGRESRRVGEAQGGRGGLLQDLGLSLAAGWFLPSLDSAYSPPGPFPLASDPEWANLLVAVGSVARGDQRDSQEGQGMPQCLLVFKENSAEPEGSRLLSGPQLCPHSRLRAWPPLLSSEKGEPCPGRSAQAGLFLPGQRCSSSACAGQLLSRALMSKALFPQRRC